MSHTQSNESNPTGSEKQMTIIDHIRELRKAVIVCVLAVLIAFAVILFCGGDWLLSFMLEPLKDRGVDVVFTNISEYFLTEMKVALLAGIIVAFPVVILELWLYLRPALYPQEKKVVVLSFFSCLFLFLLGVAFAYFVVLSLAIDFFVTAGGDLATPMLTISNYVKFIYSFLLPFGLMFQLPLVCFVFAKIGILKADMMRKVRKYVIFVIFVVAAILTPPDVISQLLLAIPMMILYEISVWIVRVVKVSKERQQTEEEES